MQRHIAAVRESQHVFDKARAVPVKPARDDPEGSLVLPQRWLRQNALLWDNKCPNQDKAKCRPRVIPGIEVDVSGYTRLIIP